MPVESLILKNFQCHTGIEIPFDPGVTVLLGASDTGKSAVLRALRWLTFNRPAGDEFKKDGTDRVAVTLKLDGHKIVRRKSDSNAYLLDGAKMVAFGTKVPEDVGKLLALSEINFQGQFDAPFWFSESGGEVAKRLNAIVDLRIIDRTMANLATESRRLTAVESVCVQRTQQELAEVKRLRSVKLADAALKEVEELAAESSVAALNATETRSLVERGEECLKEHERRKSRLVALQGVVEQAEQWEQIEEEKDALQDAISAVEAAKENLCTITKQLKSTARQFKTELGELCPLCGQSIPKHAH